MGMSIEDSEIIVAKIVANDSKSVRPLAIKVKDFNVRGVTKEEVEVSLERLKKVGAVKEYRARWGFFIKKAEEKHQIFEETGSESQFDDGDQAGKEEEVYVIEVDESKLKKHIASLASAHTVIRTIEKHGNDFYCNDRKIPFDTYSSIHYFVLNILYGDDGLSRSMTYEELNDELEKPLYNQSKLEEKEKKIERIKNAVHNGLYRQAGDFIKGYVRIEPRVGIALHNPPKK